MEAIAACGFAGPPARPPPGGGAPPGIGIGPGVAVGTDIPGGGGTMKGLGECFFFFFWSSAMNPSFRKRFQDFFQEILHLSPIRCQFITWGEVAGLTPSVGGRFAPGGA